MNRAQLTAAKDADRYSRIAYLLRPPVRIVMLKLVSPAAPTPATPSGKFPKCTMPASRPRAAAASSRLTSGFPFFHCAIRNSIF